jgi:hypothetical protein
MNETINLTFPPWAPVIRQEFILDGLGRENCQIMNTTEAKNTRDFCEKHGITISATLEGKREQKPTSKDGKPWAHFLWRCTLTRSDARAGKLEQEYRMGLAHVHTTRRAMESLGIEKKTAPTPPKAEDVIDSLIMDASAIGQTFDDWASEFGYDTDSRQAEKVFHECQDAGARLLKFLGRELFDDLQNNYERL